MQNNDNLFCYRLIFLFTITCCMVCTISAQQNKKARQVVFRKHILSNIFVSEGVATGDVNRDGKMDILAGNYWFQAPDWKRNLIHIDTLNPVPGYSTSFLNYSMDVNNDGWNDLIKFDQPGAACSWYQNPKNKKGIWKSHIILANAGMENPDFVDVDRNGRMDIIDRKSVV